MVIGRVYKIIHNQSDITYVGSTRNILKQRWQQHKASYERWLKSGKTELSIYPYFEKYGIENFKLVLIKEYEIIDQIHLEAYEQLWINKLKCCNKCCPFQIYRLYQKQWRKQNKNKLAEYHRKYNEDNKEQLSDYKKKWYEENKDEHSKKRKLQYEKNKKVLQEKIICDCGNEVSKGWLTQHKKTKKHLNYFKNISQS